LTKEERNLGWSGMWLAAAVNHIGNLVNAEAVELLLNATASDH
jgi:hypothetical protein